MENKEEAIEFIKRRLKYDIFSMVASFTCIALESFSLSAILYRGGYTILYLFFTIMALELFTISFMISFLRFNDNTALLETIEEE